MIKSLFLTIMGWLRSIVSKNTDLRYAGKEHIRNVNKKIEDLRAQRNLIAGRGVGLENQLAELDKQVKRAENAVKEWNARGDITKRDAAYAEYKRHKAQYNTVNNQLQDVIQQVDQLDYAIQQLETDSGKAEDNMNSAAAKQQYSRAAEGVEDIHDLLKTGPLADAQKAAEEQGNIAEARRRSREASNKDDLYQFDDGVDSMESLLGSSDSSNNMKHVREERQAPQLEQGYSLPKPTYIEHEPVRVSEPASHRHDNSRGHDDGSYTSDSSSSSSNND